MSSKPKILVTTAAGKTGKATTLALLEKGFPVRAFVRKHDSRSKDLEDAGAEVFVGNMMDFADVTRSLEGVRRAYVCVPLDHHCLHKSVAFGIAAVDAKLDAIVWMSQWLSDPRHRSLPTRETYYSDRVLQWLPNVITTVVNPGWFADNYFLLMGPMAQLGLMPLPLGEGRNAPPSNEDMGRVIAAILTNPEPHGGKIYRPTGPKVLSPQDIADSVGRAVGHKVRYVDISEKMFLKALKSQGVSKFVQVNLNYYCKDYRLGGFGMGGATDVVERITGRPAEDFDTIARRYAAEMPEAKRTFGNKLKAIAGLTKLLFTRVPDTTAYERAWELPKLSTTRFAAENSHWRQSHDRPNGYGVGQVGFGNSKSERPLVAHS